MLARKHYAQKRNSKGAMNTRPVAGSSSIVLNRKIRSQTSNISKKLDEYTSEKYIEKKKHLTIKCNTADNTTTKECGPCSGSSAIGSLKRVSYVHKDIVMNSQGDYLQKKIEKNVCLENEPVLYNNIGC